MEESGKKQIVRFIRKFILIGLIILACDFVTGLLLGHFFFTQHSGDLFRTTYVIDSTRADILIMGSSRANHSYVSEKFEEKLPYTCYNSGSDGNYLLYNWAIFNTVTERYDPKVVILDIDPSELAYDPVEYERLSRLLPYYHAHPGIRKVVELRGPLEKLKLVSSVYRYNSMLLQVLAGNSGLTKFMAKDYKGYIPLTKTMDQVKIETWGVRDYVIDENKIAALKSLFTTCKQKDIRIVLVYSPARRYEKDVNCNKLVSGICSEYGVPYFNMSNLPLFMDSPGYFADESHLNDKGARIFTDMVIDKLWGEGGIWRKGEREKGRMGEGENLKNDYNLEK